MTGSNFSPEISFCDRSTLSTFDWPDISEGTRAFHEAMLLNPVEGYIRNVRTQCMLARIGGHVLPVSVNDDDWQNSWVCSPFNAAISYPLDELREIHNPVLRAGLAGLIRTVAPILKAGQINRVVCFNNWLLSTNLYPPWDTEGLEQLTSEAQQRWPQHAIMFRSLNPVSNGPLMKRLQDVGYLLAPSRQVYLCENLLEASKKQNSEIDEYLLRKKTKYRVVRDAEIGESDVPRIRQLYGQLYLQKYSLHNPQFTDELIRLWRETGVLKMIGLRSPAGSLDGIVGCFAVHNVVTTPLIGYDLNLPQKLGLYRMLTSLVFEEARTSGRLLNLSAGAAKFKRHRGGEPHLEYSAVYIRHLPMFRRTVWRGLAGLLTHVGARILHRYEL